jgi:selenocysteine lyase/cysteine desulfurase
MELPILQMAAACKRASDGNATVVIDAAHSLFAIENLSIYHSASSSSSASGGGNSGEEKERASISDVADYWLTNAHKWLCNPKGAAFMWVSPRVKACTRPAIISHGFAPSSSPSSIFPADKKLLSAFSWDGCRDYASLLTVPSAIAAWDLIDDFAQGAYKAPPSRLYMNQLLQNAVNLLATEWKVSEEDFAAPFEMRKRCPLALVPLPRKVRGVDTRSGKNTDKEAFQLQEWLHHNHLVEVPVKCQQGNLYLRISAHVYNDIEDYVKLVQIFRNEI